MPTSSFQKHGSRWIGYTKAPLGMNGCVNLCARGTLWSHCGTRMISVSIMTMIRSKQLQKVIHVFISK